ncbi:MAG: biotin/lipoyl-containing protein [Spirochaetota bacterium]
MLDQNMQKTTFHAAESEWLRSFSLNHIKCLIVCRGPVRKETMDVFDDIGVKEYGILLSEKDSIVYPKTLAPELRGFRFPKNIHRVPDYMGAGAEEKKQRIQQILGIAKDNGYTHIFAGYGFMAEDFEFIEAIEKSGVAFMGPGSHVARQAGAKDEAKKLARKIGVSVTPGIDNVSALALLSKAKDKAALEKTAKDNDLSFQYDDGKELADNAEDLLLASYSKGIDIISVSDLQQEAEKQVEEIWKKFPKNRIRFKYIGGGGGKGQRIVGDKDQVAGAVMEILAESKVVEKGSNRNFLIELNIENTRHNEMQLLGNGEWTISLGGRDCSLQMHEQKLLEMSFTQEMMHEEIGNSQNETRKKALEGDLQALIEMEEEGEKFGEEINLDSVSTFELILEGTNHFFMEVNTRIQVEHRVTEIAYRLKFTNPDNPEEFFYIDSLVEAMALMAAHGKRLQKPERIVRNLSAGEARINATNQALQPHAGGLIKNWSKPLEYEIRDDQGIGIRNPDTGSFIHYRVAGAYDSNIALLVSYGKSREENLVRLGEIIKKTELRGNDLQTNMELHYGMINWILGKDIMFKPSTRFMNSYLAGVGSIAKILVDLDLDILWKDLLGRTKKESPESAAILQKKLTLLVRPIKELMRSSHKLAGFIGLHENNSWKQEGDTTVFLKNPINILHSLYDYLDLQVNADKAPCYQIWPHDAEILQEALDFYADLDELAGGEKDFAFWEKAFTENKNPVADKIDADTWKACVAAHKGFQLGLNILQIFPGIAKQSGFTEIQINAELDPIIPDKFKDPENIASLVKYLAPPPKASSDEIVAPMGGMFYGREAPNMPPMIQEGDHFEAGQPLFIIEVMKMFNKINAPFSGTVVKNNLPDSDGKIVKKGQPIFKIEPDEVVKEETPEEIQARKQKVSLSLLA